MHIVTKRQMRIAASLRSKMKNFNETALTMEYEYIKGIHNQHPKDPNITLNKFLSAIYSRKYENRPLFYAIEQDNLNDPTLFHYNVDLEQEVKEVVTALPILIEAVFGKAVATEWIDKAGWGALKNYTFTFIDPKDPFKGIIIKTHDNEDKKTPTKQYDEFEVNDLFPDEEADIYITNLDMIRMETEKTHILQDDGKSCQTSSSTVDSTTSDTKTPSSLTMTSHEQEQKWLKEFQEEKNQLIENLLDDLTISAEERKAKIREIMLSDPPPFNPIIINKDDEDAMSNGSKTPLGTSPPSSLGSEDKKDDLSEKSEDNMDFSSASLRKKKALANWMTEEQHKRRERKIQEFEKHQKETQQRADARKKAEQQLADMLADKEIQEKWEKFNQELEAKKAEAARLEAERIQEEALEVKRQFLKEAEAKKAEIARLEAIKLQEQRELKKRNNIEAKPPDQANNSEQDHDEHSQNGSLDSQQQQQDNPEVISDPPINPLEHKRGDTET